MRQKRIILPKLNDCGGDLSKQWYVHYSYLDEHTGKLVRFKIYKGFTDKKTVREKKAHARKLVKRYTELLKSGWNPFEDDTEVIYKDNLAYEIAGKIEKKRAKKSLSFCLSQYLEEKKKSIADESYKTYKGQLRVFHMFLEEKKLCDVGIIFFTEEHAKEFFEYLEKERGIKGKTKNKYRNLLISIWNAWNAENVLIKNVFKSVRKFKEHTIPQKPIKQNVLELLKDELENSDPQLWLAAEFQYYCFIRPKEMRLMRIGDINLFEGEIMLRSDIAKNSKTRIVDIPVFFNKKLFSHYKLNSYPEDYFVFSLERKPSMRIIGKNYFWSRFDAIRKKLGIPKDYKFYGFKHTGAVVALKNGADIKEIQQQMGHHSIQVTDEYLKDRTSYKSEYFKRKQPPI